MEKISSVFVCALIFLSLLQIDCKKDPPVAPPPPVVKDSLFTIEREMTNGEQPAVSPDGSKIAFTYKGNIFVMDTSARTKTSWVDNSWRTDTSGGMITQLTSGPEYDVQPRWNSDGAAIGFIREQFEWSDRGMLYAVPARGGAPYQLIRDHAIVDDYKPMKWDWSPDGRYIAFLSYESDNNAKSFSILQLETNEVLFTTPFESSFAWSHVPGEIALTLKSSDPNKDREVWLMNVETNTMVKDSMYHSFAVSLCRSPLGNKFAYNASDLPASLIVVTEFNGLFTAYKVSSGLGLRWSPDEKYFIYDWTVVVPNPFGYTYSRIGLYSPERQKEYLLTQEGDVNRRNYFFEWGHAPNEVYFERYHKINKVTFTFSK